MSRLSSLVLASLLLSLTPCCLLVAGAAIAVGVVHVTGDDEAELILEGGTEPNFDLCEKEMASKGKITLASKSSRRLEGEVGSSSVVVTLELASEKTTRVRCTARKLVGLSPDKDTAQDFLNGVLRRSKG